MLRQAPGTAPATIPRNSPRTRPRWWAGPVPAAVLLAGCLQSVWALFLATDGGDMAAQYAWAQFARAHPGSAYDLAWYGGMHPASYSVLTPYLMAVLGVRTAGVVTGTLCALVLARLVVRSGVRRPLLTALCGAAGVACNTASGRITFGIGLMFAVAAVAAVYETRGTPRARALAAGLLGVLAVLASPVDGLFLLVAVPGLFVTGRRPAAYAFVAAPLLVVGATTVLFPFYGVQPISAGQVALVLVTAVPVALLSPRSWRVVRLGAWAYTLGTLLTAVIPSPIGSNVERLSLLFAATVLLPAATAARGRRAAALWLAFAVALSWQSVQPVADLLASAPAAGSTQDAKPLVAELDRLGAGSGRVEVVDAASHVGAAALAPYFELARGWNRQEDVQRNPLFYQGGLTPAEYRAWLLKWAVGYVVVPDAPLDYASVAEDGVVDSGQPWLRPVWKDAHWQVYRVTDPAPLAPAPASVLDAGAAALTVKVPTAGSTMLRVVWSPWLQVLGAGQGCLTPDGQWTRLTAEAPGTYVIGARYTLPSRSPCPPTAEPDH